MCFSEAPHRLTASAPARRSCPRTTPGCPRARRRTPLVVDPVMVSTNGTVLLKPSAAKALEKKLIPKATLITPNIPEAEALTGLRIREPEAIRDAARALQEKFGCAVLLKGGHLRGLNEAVDVLRVGRDEWLLSLPRVKRQTLHGTGCIYSAAITAGLVKGLVNGAGR